MADLVVITPSRGRPAQLAEMLAAVHGTAAGQVEVVPCLDDDDPALDGYRWMLPRAPRLVGPRKSLSGWTNHAARIVLERPDPPRWLASLGDDHRPRTRGWDRRLTDAIESLGGAPGIAYGNDLLQGPRLPTAWVMSAAIVSALGWMMLPTCRHMYTDNAILELGRATGRILYCPDVVIEHMHPLAGKGDWDPTYGATNARPAMAADRDAFVEWRRTGLPTDAAKLSTLDILTGESHG